MKGTEKQIAWAKELQRTIVETGNEVYDQMIHDPKYDPNNARCVEMAGIYKSWAELAVKEERASFFIDTFAGLKSTDTLVDRVKSIRSKLAVSANVPGKWRWK